MKTCFYWKSYTHFGLWTNWLLTYFKAPVVSGWKENRLRQMRFQNRVCPFFFFFYGNIHLECVPAWQRYRIRKAWKQIFYFFFYCLCLFPQLRLQDVGTCLFNMDKKTRENFNGFWVFIVLPLGGFVTNTTCNGICCPPARINQVRWSQNKPTMSAQLSLHFLCRPNQKLLHSYSFFFFFFLGGKLSLERIYEFIFYF